MNILFIPIMDPRLTKGGNEQRTHLLWESLKRYGKVYTYLSNYDSNAEPIVVNGEHPIYLGPLRHRKHLLWRVINGIFNRLAGFCIYKKKLLEAENPENIFKGVHFDVVVTRYVKPLCLYRYWEIAPLLIDIDDHPCQVYHTMLRNRLPFGLKTIGAYITKCQTQYLLSKAVGGWIANEEQLALCGKNYAFLPNIPQSPSSDYSVEASERKNLFTVGAMYYDPNKEGVTNFLKQVWPAFHQKYPDVEYYIVGKGASKAEAELWNSFEGVKYLGFVDDLEAMYETTLATVVPVYSGGGTCIKTLEAMAFARICLSSPFGARGLPKDVIEQKKGVLIYNNAESFITAYEKLQDSDYRQTHENQGREVIAMRYSVENFNNAIDSIISTL